MAFIPYDSPSTRRRIRAVLFDTFGTVVDWRTGVAREVAAFARAQGLNFDAEQFADEWRGLYQPALQTVRSGARPFLSLDDLHYENLCRVLNNHGVAPASLGTKVVEELNRSWHRLPAWPDSVSGLTALRSRYIIGPLSNGNTSLLLNMAKSTGLPWDIILGSDITRAYKPAPESYQRTAALLGMDPGEVMLAAAHNEDLEAAQQSGLATAFITRSDEHGPNQTSDRIPTGAWDITSRSIIDLAEQLGAEMH
ncbi:haloacid dehalogenase type II [Arthrobacter sp. H41]|uniref:haloacid dehalogenase type II n=1 Tax=Arthrobacter sp. H41 TaxID=1312978 RepID=UPI00047C1CB1|nr:haloacid dehalogenase type II [Arthrobacter sp. H41]